MKTLILICLVAACHPSIRSWPSNYEKALTRWSSIEDINAWIGAHFEYDMERALALSETQRTGTSQTPIYTPEHLYGVPRGTCVDLARFAYETALRVVPGMTLHYLMVEFEPLEIRGNTMRRHWFVTFERNGKLYGFGDSNRPGIITGPYDSLAEMVHDYEQYRARKIVDAQQRDSFEKRQKMVRQRAIGRSRS
ncbi:MAG TPA: hypothetical protein VF469_14865 [Kofleriaceae bacterium]